MGDIIKPDMGKLVWFAIGTFFGAKVLRAVGLKG